MHVIFDAVGTREAAGLWSAERVRDLSSGAAAYVVSDDPETLRRFVGWGAMEGNPSADVPVVRIGVRHPRLSAKSVRAACERFQRGDVAAVLGVARMERVPVQAFRLLKRRQLHVAEGGGGEWRSPRLKAGREYHVTVTLYDGAFKVRRHRRAGFRMPATEGAAFQDEFLRIECSKGGVLLRWHADTGDSALRVTLEEEDPSGRTQLPVDVDGFWRYDEPTRLWYNTQNRPETLITGRQNAPVIHSWTGALTVALGRDLERIPGILKEGRAAAVALGPVEAFEVRTPVDRLRLEILHG